MDGKRRRPHFSILEVLPKSQKAAAARPRQAKQESSPSSDEPPEFAKQQPEFAKLQAAPTNEGEGALPAAEGTAADEHQTQLRAIASDLLYWKGGLKVLRQAQLPKWRGCFQWQIEAQIAALQAEHATLRTEVATRGGISNAGAPIVISSIAALLFAHNANLPPRLTFCSS